MLSKFYKIIAFLFLATSLSLLISCKKNDEDLKRQIAELESRVSGIENQIGNINSNLTILQQQGKLNSDEINSLKALTSDLSTLTNEIKNGGVTNSVDIANLKTSLQQAATIIQLESLKTTITQLGETINKIDTEQKATATATSELQSAITKMAADLEELKNGESTQEINGKIEKGGFLKGSILYLFEMDSTLTQTGRSFNSTITDNYGSFSLRVKNLKGKNVRVVSSGFYFNEVSGKNSSSQISLSGLVKINTSEAVNVNILTALEEPRVKYLIDQGKSFNDAKIQSVNEVLSVFGIQNPGIKRAEKVNLIGSSSRSNILLSLSTMLVGFRSDGELTEILNDIAEDLKTDGLLNDVSLGNSIMTHLYYLDTTKVINQVKAKYTALYPDSILNKINLSYLDQFKKSTSYIKSFDLIEYPALGSTIYKGKNILNSTTTTLNNNIFEISANLVESALKFRVEVTADAGELSELLGTNKNWAISYPTKNKAILETSTVGLNTITFTTGTLPSKTATLTVKFYENGLSVPTITKTIPVNLN